MNIRLTAYRLLFFYLPFSLISSAQSAEQESELASSSPPEEITITTQRTKLQLRLQLWEAEEKAYDVFNSFNDEKRFDIKCYLHEPTGTRIKRQVCTPEFQLIATREQARDRLNGTFQHVPVEFAIASQLDDYRKKSNRSQRNIPNFCKPLLSPLKRDRNTLKPRVGCQKSRSDFIWKRRQIYLERILLLSAKSEHKPLPIIPRMKITFYL